MAEVDPSGFKVVVTEEDGRDSWDRSPAASPAPRAAGGDTYPQGRRLLRRIGRAGETDVDLYGVLYAVRHLMGESGGHRRAEDSP